MEKKGTRSVAGDNTEFRHTVKMAKQGDKNSMDEILNLFAYDIEYLSKYIMLPREDAIQSLKTELISIICNQI
jgi:hypothetical protein